MCKFVQRSKRNLVRFDVISISHADDLYTRVCSDSFFCGKAKQALNKQQFIRKVCAIVWKAHHEAFHSCVYFYILCLRCISVYIEQILYARFVNKTNRNIVCSHRNLVMYLIFIYCTIYIYVCEYIIILCCFRLTKHAT